MKTLITKSKSSLILIALVAFPAWSKPVAQVTELSGSVFVVKSDGKTSSLKVNDHLEDQSEIMVEEGGAVTLNDYYDATYHLIGGTHLKFFDRSAQLKRGKTWIQCLNGRFPLAITTANGHAKFWKGEFIATFDQATSRSQFLVVNGDVEVSNVLDREMKYTVPAGTFTMVDPEVEDGIPRAPTKIGLNSLDNALSEFKALPAKIKDVSPSRGIASVEEAPKKGEITFIKTNRLPASVSGSAHKYFAKKAKAPSYEHAPIRYLGTSWKPVAATVTTVTAPRAPASVAPMAIKPLKTVARSLDPEFEDSLKRKVTEQPKFPKELDSLIEDLKSY